MKNANGTGGIVNLGKHRRRPYAVRVTEGWIEGKQIYKYIGYYATRKEAQQALSEYHVDPLAIEKSTITFAQIWEEWQTHGFDGLSDSTIKSYKIAFKNLAPLHDKIVVELRTAEIQDVFDAKEAGYATKNIMRVVCSYIFKYAIQNDIINRDYSEYVRIGKNDKKEKTIFSRDEIETLFRHDDLPFADTVLILLYTGFRIQEFLNICKKDVNLTNWTITGGLKTEAGKNRVVPIHPRIRQYVRARYEAVQTPDAKLTDMPQSTYRKNFDILMEQLGIKGKTPHCTRHTFATLMGAEGVDPLAITKLMGHSNYNFTVKNYTHADLEFLENELEKLA